MAEYILKDSRGKEQTFADDKIFVQGTDGELVQFTMGTGEESNVLLEVQELSGFSADSDFGGAYTKNLNFGTDIDAFEIIQGQEYLVEWDGVVYGVTAQDASAIIQGALILGNGSGFGLMGYEEPFAIGYASSGITLLCLADTEETHSVGIAKRVRPENLLLQDITVTENGEYTAEDRFDGIGNVTVNVPTPEVVLQDKTITENGTYSADSGYDGLGNVTVEVAGTGGGSLPAGVYLKPVDIPYPNQYSQRWVEFNGTLYAFTNETSGNGYMGNVYKYQDGAWTSIVTGINTKWSNASRLDYVEYNSKIHIFGGYSNKHYVFDGNNLTSKTALPASASSNCAFVQNNLLKVFCSGDQTVYVWDENNASWMAETTIALSSSVDKVFETSFGVLMTGSWLEWAYLYDGETLIEFVNVGTLNAPELGDGYNVYKFKTVDGCHGINKYDLTTGARNYWFTTPGYSSNQTLLFNYNGKTHLLIGDYGGAVQVGAFEICEISE